MKLNQDCIRDLLLYLEDNLTYTDEIKINNLSLKNYSKEDLMYTADRLIEANYLNTRICWNFNETHIIMVKSITYQGHQFLDNLRDDKIWNKAKSILKPLKSVSIEIISKTLSNIIIQYINQQIS